MARVSRSASSARTYPRQGRRVLPVSLSKIALVLIAVLLLLLALMVGHHYRTRSINAAAAAGTGSSKPASVTLPKDSGVIDVRAFGAKGDGRSDDTAALRRALASTAGAAADDRLTLYLPTGTYLVSDTVTFPRPGITLQGQGIGSTKIKLRDRTPGFKDPAHPRPLLATYGGTRGTNQWRWCSLQDLTVDAGAGNSGVVAVRFLSNDGGLHNVLINAEGLAGGGIQARAGVTGLQLTQPWVGPALFDHVTVDGFDTGIEVAGAEYPVTFEHLRLLHQHSAGLVNRANLVSIRDLLTVDAVPAIRQLAWSNGTLNSGMVTVAGGSLRGGAPGNVAVENQASTRMPGFLYLRDLTSSGYRAAINDRGKLVRGPRVAEYVSGTRLGLFPAEAGTGGTAGAGAGASATRLPVRDAPTVPPGTVARDWVSVASFGARPGDGADDTKGIQAAIDAAGRARQSTVYLPHGNYVISDTIHLRGGVQRLFGMGSRLVLSGKLATNLALPSFRFENGPSTALVVERFQELGRLQDAASRTLVVRDSGLARYSNTGHGRLFLSDVASGLLLIDHQAVWARQLHLDERGTKIVNRGGTLWVLGLDADRAGTILQASGGARSEILGGLVFPAEQVPAGQPAFAATDAHLTVVAGGSAYDVPSRFQVLVRETRAGTTHTLPRTAAPSRLAAAGGFVLPLYAD